MNDRAIHNELVDILRLIRSDNIGPRTFWNLISLHKNPSLALQHVLNLSSSLLKEKHFSLYPKSKAEDEISACLAKNVQIVSYLDKDYPALLKTVEDRPPILFCLGDVSLLNQDKVAVVGSRSASANGLRFAYKISKNLVENKQVVVSGFARGIDSSAHKASVNYKTIAVLAGGIDNIYPPENEDLYYQICEKGLLVAELPLGSIPKAQNFPQRNRIISGISSAVAIIEASLRSGSLITAKFALQQNRDLFVVPGFPLDPHYQGNNYLLKQGAYLLESVEDILEHLAKPNIFRSNLFEKEENFSGLQKKNFAEKELTQARIEIINLIGASPSSIDEIVSVTQLSVEEVLTIIIELELSGKVIRHFGNKVSIKL